MYSRTRYLNQSQPLDRRTKIFVHRVTRSSPRFSQTSYKLIMCRCSISFIITTSRSIPNGIILLPSFDINNSEPTMVSIFAKLSVRSFFATCLLTILIAASWPVTACLAFLTLPDEPFPRVLPSLQGPTCVLRLDFPEAFETVEICESRFESLCDSLVIAGTRLSSMFESGDEA